MTFQQLRYLIAVAQYGSFNAAAKQLYISQSAISMAIKELEEELGILAFTRSNRGLTLTNDGTELLGYARQVVEQADMINTRFATKRQATRNRLVVSTQHYAFSVHAFVNLANEYDADQYDFTLRETRTDEIIKDVAEFRSDMGIIFLSEFNEPVLRRLLNDASLSFTELFSANTHVFVGSHHPLASYKSIKPADLEPFPRYSFEQGTNSFHYFEEPFAALPHKKNITFRDRGTLTNLLTHGKGYTLSTGVLSDEMQQGIVSIPLEANETMHVGYIMHKERKPSTLVLRYIEELKKCIEANDYVQES